MQVLCSLLVGLACFGYGTASETVEVDAGEPFILNFDYSGPTVGIRKDLTKDGEKVMVDNTRIFQQHDKLYFTEVEEHDSGEYRLTITGNGIDSVEKIIVLSVAKNTDRQNQGPYSPELTELKAIAEEQKEVVKRSTVEVEDQASIAEVSSHLSRSDPVAAKNSKARVTVERILIRALKEADIPPLEYFPELEFPQCVDPPMPSDCSSPYRSTDGTCNNIANPLRGASNTAYRRLLPSEYEDEIYVPIGANQSINCDPFAGPWPSPRYISNKIITDALITTNRFSMFFTVFGQTIALDYTRSGTFSYPNCSQSCDEPIANLPFCMPIYVADSDPVYGIGGSNGGRCLPLRRGIGACNSTFNSTFSYSREQINTITHYLDASGIYGNNDEEAADVRMFTGGQLKQSGRTETYKGDLPILPEESQGGPSPPFFFFAGDIRIENYVHQTNIYTLWYRLHNAIVDELARINPCWDDEKLFQEGRKIVIAIWQIIIYREYLPLLFGDQYDTYIGDYERYDPSVDATIPHSFATAAGRFGHSMFHSDTDRLDSEGNTIPAGRLNLRDAFFNPAEYYIGGGVDPLVRGMLADQSRELDQFLTIVLTILLFPPPGGFLGSDLASLNIQRARERGLPPYRAWQKYCEDKYKVSATFMSEVDQQLREVYGPDGYDDGIDLWVGGLSEERLPGGTPLGPTFACLIGITYSDLRDGDRFYWENPTMFNNAQRESLSQMTMSKVICECADNIPNIRRSAFSLNGEPVNCSSLPFVDLNLWRDLECNDVTVAFARRTYGVNEEDGSVQPALVLSQPVSTSITVNVSSSDRSARGGEDYVSGPFTVTILAGQTTASFDVPIINDSMFERNEVFRLTIDQSSAPDGVNITNPNGANVVIADDSDCIPCNITRNFEVRGRSVIATFSSSNPSTTFFCRLDRTDFESCTSPRTFGNLNRRNKRVSVAATCPCKSGLNVKHFKFQIR